MRRWTNLALLGLLTAVFLTGWLAFSYASAPSRWSLIVHAVAGLGIVALTPWKSLIARRSLRRKPPGWWASLAFSLLVLVSVIAGLLHSTGLLRWFGGITAMEVHVGAAIAAIPFAICHVVARHIPIRQTDFSRRSFLRAGLLLGSAGLAYIATEGLARASGLAGAGRRFTGSYELASFQPELMPVTQWMFDRVPRIDVVDWWLTVRHESSMQKLTYEELSRFDDRARATLDCTGGFYSEQEWAGVWLSRLIPNPGQAQSIHVRSHTGYGRRFPVQELPRLLLATRAGGRPLDAGHGFPVRIMAPDRRGFWWVKWVTSITVDDAPYWWQSPFPLQ